MSDEVKRHLQIKDEPVWYINRLQYIDNEPFLLEYTYLTLSFFPDLTQDLLTKHSLYKLLEDKYKIIPIESHEIFHAINIEAKKAEILNISSESSSMLIERTAYHGSKPFEYTKSYRAGDKYRYYNNIKMEEV